MSDELPTATRVSDPGIRALYRLENRWQAWLDVEAALAARAGGARHHPARGGRGDRPAPRSWSCSIAPASTRGSPAPATPSCRWSGNSAGSSASRMAAGCIGAPPRRTSRRPATCWCCARRTRSSCAADRRRRCTPMADLAERGAEMPIAGRTHGQHAVPATFGYKVAVWIDEMLRHVERFRQAAPRVFVAMLGGGGRHLRLARRAGTGGAGRHRRARSAWRSMTVPARTHRRPPRREHLHPRPARARPAARSGARSTR